MLVLFVQDPTKVPYLLVFSHITLMTLNMTVPTPHPDLFRTESSRFGSIWDPEFLELLNLEQINQTLQAGELRW